MICSQRSCQRLISLQHCILETRLPCDAVTRCGCEEVTACVTDLPPPRWRGGLGWTESWLELWLRDCGCHCTTAQPPPVPTLSRLQSASWPHLINPNPYQTPAKQTLLLCIFCLHLQSFSIQVKETKPFHISHIVCQAKSSCSKTDSFFFARVPEMINEAG